MFTVLQFIVDMDEAEQPVFNTVVIGCEIVHYWWLGSLLRNQIKHRSNKASLLASDPRPIKSEILIFDSYATALSSRT